MNRRQILAGLLMTPVGRFQQDSENIHVGFTRLPLPNLTIRLGEPDGIKALVVEYQGERLEIPAADIWQALKTP